MTPENSRLRPELFLHDACLSGELQPPASEPSGREESLNSLEARLAADIRAIDGNHDKGAAELAEQLIARGWFSQSARLEASHAALQAKLDAVEQLPVQWRSGSRRAEDCADELTAALAE
jgi:glyoxylase-like metal-dependent hydrolase (beta-lactamase superfamily II)